LRHETEGLLRLVRVGRVAIDPRDRRAQRIDRRLRRAGRHDDHALDDPVGGDDGLVDLPELPGRHRAFDLVIEVVEHRDRQTLHAVGNEEVFAVVAGIVEHRDRLPRLHHAGLDHATVTRRRFREEIDFAALERQPRRRARAVAGHVFERDAQHVHREPQAQVLGRVDAQPAEDEALGLDDVGWLHHAGRNVGAHEMDGGAGLGRDELVGLEVDAKALRIERIHEGGAGEVADHRAIARRHLSQVLSPDNAAGAVHVLDDDIGRPVDVAGEVLGEQATLDVGRPAGCEVDQDGETLARVEGIIRVRHRCGHRESGAKRDDGAHPKHRDPPRVCFAEP